MQKSPSPFKTPVKNKKDSSPRSLGDLSNPDGSLDTTPTTTATDLNENRINHWKRYFQLCDLPVLSINHLPAISIYTRQIRRRLCSFKSMLPKPIETPASAISDFYHEIKQSVLGSLKRDN